MRRFLILFFIFLAGCTAHAPDHDLADLENINNESALREITQYNNSILQKADILSLIAFNFKGRTMSAIGITKLDSKNDSFSVAGLTPMGMTLFKIKMEKGKVISSFVMPQFGADDLNKTADMISKDIARIYFNRKIKFSKKSFEHKKFVIIINTESDIKKYKFTFGGRPLKLITKSMYENKKKIWSVDYYDYQKINTREIPFKIFFKNYKYGYTLEVETKEIKRELIK